MLNEIFQNLLNDPWSTANLVVVVLLVSFEIIIPLKKTKILSRAQLEDIFWLCTNKIISFNLWGILLYKFGDYLSRLLAGYNFNLEAQSIFLQFFIFFIFSDFLSFLSHRFLHKNNFLWRFHQLHHSTETLTTLSAFRHHWIEDLYYGLFSTVLTSLFIVDPKIRLVVSLLISSVCYFQHSNLRLNLGQWLEYIVITPLNHRWHHSKKNYRPKGQNFGLFLTLWDRLFDSYYILTSEPTHLGISENYPKTLARRLVYPFIK